METILSQLRKMNLESATKEEPLNKMYRCRVCGYIFNEAQEGKPFSSLKECPTCHMGPDAFQRIR